MLYYVMLIALPDTVHDIVSVCNCEQVWMCEQLWLREYMCARVNVWAGVRVRWRWWQRIVVA